MLLRFWIGGAKSPWAGMWVPLDGVGVARVICRDSEAGGAAAFSTCSAAAVYPAL
jgi:hypothetical protein